MTEAKPRPRKRAKGPVITHAHDVRDAIRHEAESEAAWEGGNGAGAAADTAQASRDARDARAATKPDARDSRKARAPAPKRRAEGAVEPGLGSGAARRPKPRPEAADPPIRLRGPQEPDVPGSEKPHADGGGPDPARDGSAAARGGSAAAREASVARNGSGETRGGSQREAETAPLATQAPAGPARVPETGSRDHLSLDPPSTGDRDPRPQGVERPRSTHEHDSPLTAGSRILEPVAPKQPVPATPPPPVLARKERLAQARVAQEIEHLAHISGKKAKPAKARREPAAGPSVAERLARHLSLVAPRARRVGYEPRPVLEVPDPPEHHTVEESLEVVPGRAIVRLLYDGEGHSHVYQVLEPRLTDLERQVMEFIRDTLLRTLDGTQASFGRDRAEATLLEGTRRAILDHAIIIDETGLQRVEYHLVRDFLGYGPVDVLMRDPMIEDISCDGPGIPIYLFHRRHESLRTNVVFPDDLALDSFVIRLAQRSGKHISIAEPLLDATLPDGSRLQTTLAREVTTRGSSFTIRKFRADPMTPPDLVRLGTFSAELAAYFWMVIEHGHSFLLAGGTASGKTTSLNAICQFIPPAKKIVSIEDTREINLSHDNWIAGLTRSGFGGQVAGGKPAGTIDMYRLLEAALRQRPEYLLVGEVRGPEALTLFQAMATGHAVYSTMHADSVPSAVYRLENPPINVPRIMLQTLDVVAIQTQQRVKGRMARRLREVVEVVGVEPGTMELLTNTVFAWDSKADRYRFLGKSHVFELIMDRRNLTEDQVTQEWRRRIEVIEWMVRERVPDYKAVARIVGSYYRDAPALVARIHGGAKAHEGV